MDFDEIYKSAMEVIGDIEPVYERDTDSWVFEHPAFPVICSGETPEEVKEKYPKYLEALVGEYCVRNLNPLVEEKMFSFSNDRERELYESIRRVDDGW